MIGSGWIPELKILGDGATINYGDYDFTCIETPGHTMCQTCLYEPNKKILTSGDHILIDITPNIQCRSDEWNPLKEYMVSLEKVYDAGLVLPGHQRIFYAHRRRIRELQTHHRHRLAEVTAILRHATASAYETASMMAWDIKADSWDVFPVAQQLFATGEALAQLQYLGQEKFIRRHTADGIIRFTRNNRERIFMDNWILPIIDRGEFSLTVMCILSVAT